MVKHKLQVTDTKVRENWSRISRYQQMHHGCEHPAALLHYNSLFLKDPDHDCLGQQSRRCGWLRQEHIMHVETATNDPKQVHNLVAQSTKQIFVYTTAQNRTRVSPTHYPNLTQHIQYFKSPTGSLCSTSRKDKEQTVNVTSCCCVPAWSQPGLVRGWLPARRLSGILFRTILTSPSSAWTPASWKSIFTTKYRALNPM